MRKYCVAAVYFVVVIVIALMAACSGGNSIAISLPAGDSVIVAGSNGILLSASGATSMYWTLSAGCGTLSVIPTTAVSSGVQVTYTPPATQAAITSGCTVTITVTSTTNPSLTKQVKLTIDPITMTVTANPAGPNFNSGAGPVTLTAALTNLPSNLSSSVTVGWTLGSTFTAIAAHKPSKSAATAFVLESTCGTIAAGTSSEQELWTPGIVPSSCTATIGATATITIGGVGIALPVVNTVLTANAITVTGLSPFTVVESGTSAALSAIVHGYSGSDTTVDWSVSPSICGTFTPNTSTSGGSVTFTAAAPIPAGCGSGAAMVTAASDANPAASDTVAVTISPITVGVTSPTTPPTLAAGGGTQVITVTTNDPKGPSNLQPSLSNPACGSVLETGSTANFTYTSPADAAAPCSTTVMFASKTDPSATATSPLITVNPITVSVSPSGSQSPILSGSAAQPLSASTNDPAGAATLTWTLVSSPVSPSCGSIGASPAASNSYTPPVLLATSCTATVTVASKTDQTKTATVTFTVNPAPITVALVSPSSPVSVGNGATQLVTATIYNDANAQGFSAPSLNPTTGCGSMSAMTLKGTSGATSTYTGTYTAAGSVGGTTSCSATLVLASVANPAATTTPLTINVIPGIAVTLSPAGTLSIDANSSNNPNNPLPITPTVLNDSAAKGVTVTLNNSACGSAQYPLGTPLVQGSAGTQIPSGTAFYFVPLASLSSECPVTVTTTSVSDTTKTATLNLSVYPPLALPAASTSVPGSGTVGENYTPVLSASGGTGSGYSWTVTGLTTNGLSSNATTDTGSTLNISATPLLAPATTVPFSVTVKDSTGTTVTVPYSIVVNAYTAVGLPTPNPSSLPSATVGQNYTGAINATGGIQTYTFTVNGTTILSSPTLIATNGGGLSGTNSGGNTLTISGTPTVTAGNTITLNVSVKDGEGNTASQIYTIPVNSAPAFTVGTQNGSTFYGVTDYTLQMFLNVNGGTPPYTLITNTTAGGCGTNAPSVGPPDGLQYSNLTNSILFYPPGAPAAGLDYSFCVQLQDSSTQKLTSNALPLTIYINGGPDGSGDSYLENQTYVCRVNGFTDATNTTPAFPWSLLSQIKFDSIGIGYSGAMPISMAFGAAPGAPPTGFYGGTIYPGTQVGSVDLGADHHGTLQTTTTVPGVTFPVSGNDTVTANWAIEADDVNDQFGTTDVVATGFHGIEIDDVGAADITNLLQPSGNHGEFACVIQNLTVPTFTWNGSWAFEMGGVTGSTNSFVPQDTIGVFTVSGSSVTNYEIDNQAAGGSPLNSTGSAGSITVASNDIATSLILGKNGTVNATAYPINSFAAFILATDATGGMESGSARLQVQSTFSNPASLSSADTPSSFVWYEHGKHYTLSGTTLTTDDGIATLAQGTGNGSSGVTFNLFYQDNSNTPTTGTTYPAPYTYDAVSGNNNGGTMSAFPGRTATFPVTANGRAVGTLSGATSGNIYLYLYGPNEGLTLNTTNGYMALGELDPQTIPSAGQLGDCTLGTADGTCSYVISQLPVDDPNASDKQGMLMITAGSPNTSGTVTGFQDKAGELQFSWDEPLNQGSSGTITYAYDVDSFGSVDITVPASPPNNPTAQTCADLQICAIAVTKTTASTSTSAGSVATIVILSNDSDPNVMILQQ